MSCSSKKRLICAGRENPNLPNGTRQERHARLQRRAMYDKVSQRMINVEVKKNQSENVASVMRRFTRKVQSAGIVQRVRSIRYFSRTKSENMRRRSALLMLQKQRMFQELYKLGRAKKETKKRGALGR